MNLTRVGNVLRNKLDPIEQRIHELKGEIECVGSARYPAQEAIEGIMGDVDRVLEDGAYWAGAYSSPFGYAKLPGNPLTFGNVVALLEAIVGRKALKAGIAQIVAQRETDEVGLPRSERPKKIAELRAKLFEAELNCEREILRLEAQGHLILRRADTDVAALVQVWDETAELPPSA
jgi:hypothetical protein